MKAFGLQKGHGSAKVPRSARPRGLAGMHQRCMGGGISKALALGRNMLWDSPVWELLELSCAHRIRLLIRLWFLRRPDVFLDRLAYRLTYFLLPFFCRLPSLGSRCRFQILLG